MTDDTVRIMPTLRIVLSRDDGRSNFTVLRELRLSAESAKRVTKSRVARILAMAMPGFRRQKGRFARFAGSEVLPVLEITATGWRAWRLATNDESPTGFEPSLPGRTGQLNAKDNPFADRTRGIWECADISEVTRDAPEAR
ncbi:MAG: hypothetical protein ACJ8F1_22910 [Polyangia bacterium]